MTPRYKAYFLEWILSVSLYPTFHSSRNVAEIIPYYLTGDKEEKCGQLLFVFINLNNRPVFKEEIYAL